MSGWWRTGSFVGKDDAHGGGGRGSAPQLSWGSGRAMSNLGRGELAGTERASSRASQAGTNSCYSVPDTTDGLSHAAHRVSSISQPTALYTGHLDVLASLANVTVLVEACITQVEGEHEDPLTNECRATWTRIIEPQEEQQQQQQQEEAAASSTPTAVGSATSAGGGNSAETEGANDFASAAAAPGSAANIARSGALPQTSPLANGDKQSSSAAKPPSAQASERGSSSVLADTAAVVAAKALYIVEVTRARASYAEQQQLVNQVRIRFFIQNFESVQIKEMMHS
ncbi:hypothetical protein DUNSADRAFT_12447 [Dunaliella salina]|uniref:Uncharacterized protein n=1 Tax=Dunaliella salina TaxID=3046 RepID=A0ABQ7H3U5_DUNSA|nr:hypothetical protein DUNSADRAFT_12447 [Dunaliella salina]|eukprot:KAF5841519.1 hypothetical protein DUNSADRAFT_12447 [Dunaliella salina]